MEDVTNENTEKLLREIETLNQRVLYLETQVFDLKNINQRLRETFMNYCNAY
jgi:hypothetical protein